MSDSSPLNAGGAMPMTFAELTVLPRGAGSRPDVIDCLADLHLQRSQPGTWQAFRHYLEVTPASHILLLGDLFEVWVGDDCLQERGSFEAEVAQALRACTAAGKAVYFMHGNRDFVIGQDFAAATGVQLLQDPTILRVQGAGAWLLSHGDALCTDDLPYQQFRAISRNPAWQQKFLAQPLAARRAFAASIRHESQSRKQEQDAASYVDLNADATRAWLRKAGCSTLIHGHTHMPATHDLGDGLQRIVLSDWDLEATPARAQVLRLSPAAGADWQRVSVVSP